MKALNGAGTYGKCRCCLAKGKHQDTINREDHIESFREHLNLFLDLDSRITQLICSACLTFLRDVRTFRQKVVASEKELLKYINKETVFVNENEDGSSIKTEIESDLDNISEIETFEDIELSTSKRKRRLQKVKTNPIVKRIKYESESDESISQIKEKKAEVEKKTQNTEIIVPAEGSSENDDSLLPVVKTEYDDCVDASLECVENMPEGNDITDASDTSLLKTEIEIDLNFAPEAFEDFYKYKNDAIVKTEDYLISEHSNLETSQGRDDEATTCTSTGSRGPRKQNAQYFRDYRARKRAEREKELLNRTSDPSTINVAGSVTSKKRKTAAEYQREYRARNKAKRNNILIDSLAVIPSTAGPSTNSDIGFTKPTRRKTPAESQREYRARKKSQWESTRAAKINCGYQTEN